MENRKKEIRLDGKWRVVRKFATGDEVGKSLTLYEDYFVEFATDGIIIETLGGKVSETPYYLDADNSTIEILATGTKSSPISGAGSAIFRIVPLNDREMYLQSPHSVEADGDFELILLERMQM